MAMLSIRNWFANLFRSNKTPPAPEESTAGVYDQPDFPSLRELTPEQQAERDKADETRDPPNYQR